MSSIAKEKTNGWYGVTTYYIGKTLADMPFQSVCPILYIGISYIITQQPREWERFALATLPYVIMTLIAQSQGIIVGAVLMKDLISAVFLAPSTCVPLMLFSGFFIRVDYIPSYFQFGVVISYVRYAFENAVMAIYGYERCGEDTVAIVTTINQRLSMFLSNVFRIALSGGSDDEYDDEDADNAVKNMTTSMVKGITKQLAGKIENVNGQDVVGVLAEFKISDTLYLSNLVALLITFLIMRVVSYQIISIKCNTSK